MKRKYSDEKILQILGEVKTGAKVQETCRKYRISNATYYNWKSQYEGMQVSEIKRLVADQDLQNQ